MSKKPRNHKSLSKEDRSLWDKVSGNLDRVYPVKDRKKLSTSAPAPVANPPKKQKLAPLAEEAPQDRTRDTPSQRQVGKSIPPAATPIEKQLRRGLRRRRIGVDRQIDLHGLTQAEAHDRLLSFVQAAHRDGAKLVLVITGKGGDKRVGSLSGSGQGQGILRQAFPRWMAERQFRDMIIGFESAQIHHGGDGAFYVRIKKGTKLKSVNRQQRS